MNGKLLILLALVASVGWSAPRAIDRSLQPSDRANYRHLHPVAGSLDEDSLHQFDVTAIYADLEFDLESSGMRGDVLICVRADEISLERLDFRFSSSLNIDSVWSETAGIASLEREGIDSLQIYLAEALPVGDSAEIHVTYSGQPEIIDDWGGIRFHQESGWRPAIMFTMGDGLDLEPPPANHTWLPSFADPADKVLWETHITAPAGYVAVSGGTRVDTVHHDSTITWHYRLDQPVSTYLIFVAVSDYEIMVQREADPLIENYVYPSRVTQAETHFSNVPQVLDGFVELFGPYPFDRFGFNLTRLGDMEHATCVSHLDQLVAANHTYDDLLFHELSHMWWGDWVTIGDWRDLWLNEGIASYCSALGFEILEGPGAYRDYVTGSLMPAARTSPIFPIYDPVDYWSSTVYEKGACVMHMLRWVMGDSLFFEALRDYGQQYAYSNAVTTDFQAVFESHYGETLQWFFDQWIYEGTRYPRYDVIVCLSCIYSIQIDQVQPGDTYFRMPVELDYYQEGQLALRDTIWTEAAAELSYWNEEPEVWADSVVLDPNNWLLKTAAYHYVGSAQTNIGMPGNFGINSVYPNPFNPRTTIAFELPRTSEVALTVYTLEGREVSHETFGPLTAGTHAVVWDGSGHASGVYLFKLSTQGFMQMAKAILLK